MNTEDTTGDREVLLRLYIAVLPAIAAETFALRREKVNRMIERYRRANDGEYPSEAWIEVVHDEPYEIENSELARDQALVAARHISEFRA